MAVKVKQWLEYHSKLEYNANLWLVLDGIMVDSESYFIKLAETLAALFEPMLQVELYRGQGEKVFEINRLHNQDVGVLVDYDTRLIAEGGREIKAVRIPLDAHYYFLLFSDIGPFKQFHAFLGQYLKSQSELPAPMVGQEQIDLLIEGYCADKQIAFSGLNSKAKRDLVFYLNQKGMFKYQEASTYLAQKLSVSRATIYNYLKLANQLKAISIHQVDAFTDEPFSGNPAGVVLEADELDETIMKKIAREMNLSETAFVLPSKNADIQLRYFTPTGHEVKFCGHSTVSTLYMLAHERKCNINQPGEYNIAIETAVGKIDSAITLNKDDSINIKFNAPKIKLIKTKHRHADLAKRLGIDLSLLNQTIPVQLEQTNQDLYITVKSLEALKDLQVNTKLAKQFSEEQNLVCLCFVSTEAMSEDSDIHMRCYAPAVGIEEDPFTGSVLGGLGAYITQNKLIKPKTKPIRVEQGHFINRPGYVDIAINNKNKATTVTVYAKARHFFSTYINM